jgi:hypothetical protein
MTARSRLTMAVSSAGVAALAAIAAALGVFARGSGEFITVTSARSTRRRWLSRHHD